MGKLINNESASEFIETIEDPIVRKLVLNAYQTLCLLDDKPAGDFDLLFFSKVIESFLRDRAAVERALRGEFDQYDDGWWS